MIQRVSDRRTGNNRGTTMTATNHDGHINDGHKW